MNTTPLSDQRSRTVLHAVCLSGLALHTYTMVFRAEGPASLFLLGLFVWSCLPYALAAFGLSRIVQALFAAGYAIGALAGDVFMHLSVFVFPKGSTAALGLLFMPLWNLLALGPLGALLAWAARRLWQSARSDRS